MACLEVESAPLLVAAIDFGTTYSGYAFATLASFKEDPLKIHGYAWTSGSAGLSLKTPTCVLFDPSQTFHSFGSQAEDKYTELAETEDHRIWYYFRRFKMELYRRQDTQRDLQFEDDQGKLMPAMKVITESIRYLSEHMMQQLEKKEVTLIRLNEINWVLTVPAIWSDTAKFFMREAAVKAGIPNSQLVLALEPEAASIYCKYLPTERMVKGGKSSLDAFLPGTKYLIIDVGGGTTDIAVQEVRFDGSIKQLFIANGGDWGGTKVDEAFEEFLQELVGAPAFNRFRDEEKGGRLDLLREFEIKKRSIKPDTTNKVTFKVPISLTDAYEAENGEDLRDRLSKLSRRVTWVGNKLRVEPDTAGDLFSCTCDYITEHLQQIFYDPKVNVTNIILMVGGFSQSLMFRDAVEKAFPNKTIIIPEEAELVVLKGAVMFGFEPRIISSTIIQGTVQAENDSEDKKEFFGCCNKPYTIPVFSSGPTVSAFGMWYNSTIIETRVAWIAAFRLVLQVPIFDLLYAKSINWDIGVFPSLCGIQSPEVQEMADTDLTHEFLHLGDKNRPHSLGNRFSDLFQDTWLSTIKLLKDQDPYKKNKGKRFEKTVDNLYHIIKMIDTICMKVSYEQFITIVNGLTTSITNSLNTIEPQTKDDIDSFPSESVQTKAEAMAQEFRKSVASDTLPVLQKKILYDQVKGKILRIPISEDLETCINDCVELMWLMYIQQPSMELVWAKPGEVFDTEQFEFIGNARGKRVRLTVWPAVLLHKDGDLVAKGHAVSI